MINEVDVANLLEQAAEKIGIRGLCEEQSDEAIQKQRFNMRKREILVK